MSNKRLYRITLTSEQAQVVISALDFWSRIGIGQFDELRSRIRYEEFTEVSDEGKNHSPDLDDVGQDLDELRDAAFPGLKGMGSSGSYGIYSPKVRGVFRVAYLIQQVIRHRLAWDRNPSGGHTVDFGEPMNRTDGPLPPIVSFPEENTGEKEIQSLAGTVIGYDLHGSEILSGSSVVALLHSEDGLSSLLAFVQAYAYGTDKGDIKMDVKFPEPTRYAYSVYSSIFLDVNLVHEKIGPGPFLVTPKLCIRVSGNPSKEELTDALKALKPTISQSDILRGLDVK